MKILPTKISGVFTPDKVVCEQYDTCKKRGLYGCGHESNPSKCEEYSPQGGGN